MRSGYPVGSIDWAFFAEGWIRPFVGSGLKGVAVSDFDFQRDFDRIFQNPDLSIDQRLDQLVGLLNQLEPSLLQLAGQMSDHEIEEAFLEFVDPTGLVQGTRDSRFLAVLVAAAEFKQRADRTGVTAMEYARLIRVRREMDDV